MDEDENKTKGCLIVAVIGFLGLLLIGTLVAIDINPKAETALTIIGTIIITVAAIVIMRIDR